MSVKHSTIKSEKECKEMVKEYRIYRFKKPQSEEMVTKFFTPEVTLQDFLNRMSTVRSLTNDGYILAGMVAVDECTYINVRLDETVMEYCRNEEYHEEVNRRYHQSEIGANVYYDTIQMVDDRKWTLLHTIDKQVGRLLRKDYEVRNEIAVQIYDGLHGFNSIRF